MSAYDAICLVTGHVFWLAVAIVVLLGGICESFKIDLPGVGKRKGR